MCEKLEPGRFFLCAPYFERVLHGKIAVDLDVNIILSKYGFNGVAPFGIVMFGLRIQDLLPVLAFPSTLHAKLNSLEKSRTFKV